MVSTIRPWQSLKTRITITTLVIFLTSTVLLAMLALVALVDGASYGLRKVLA